MALNNKALKNSITRSIRGSRKYRAVLFTDIEGSTAYWEDKGDLNGRLMVDAHNRLLFPVIERFHGKVLKTIGDSIMASFKKPKHALRAAIAMQQVLQQKIEADHTFNVKVRMGLHYGKTYVEPSDLYGDSVNLAARIESRAKGQEILVSENFAKKLNHNEYCLKEHSQFKAKGKKELVQVYQCDWQKISKPLFTYKESNFYQMSRRQKKQVIFSAIAAVIAVFWIAWQYLRFLAFDQDQYLRHISLVSENSQIIILTGGLLSLLGLLTLLIRASKSDFIFRVCKGLTLFFFISIASESLFSKITLNTWDFWNQKIYQSKNTFATPLEPNSAIYGDISDSDPIKFVKSGEPLLVQDQKVVNSVRWLKLLSIDRSVWAPQWIPAKVGSPTIELFNVEKFEIYGKDLLALALALAGFLFGFTTFRIEPF